MTVITEWNLASAESILESAALPQWQQTIEQQLSGLGRAIGHNPSSEVFQPIIELDTELHKIWSAGTLLELSGKNSTRAQDHKAWLLSASERFTSLIDTFIDSLSGLGDRLAVPIRDWLQSVIGNPLAPALQQGYQTLINQWQAGGIPAWQALTMRHKIDPEAIALDHRLLNNRLKAEEVAFTSSHKMESRAYFNGLLDEARLPSTTLTNLRDMESEQYEIFNWPLDKALEHVREALSGLHSCCVESFDALIKNGRLRFLSTPEEPDLCLDTPFGSFVQVHFDGSLYSLIRLVHEVGHAIYQNLHRASERFFLPLTDVDSETWALAFEQHFLHWLIGFHYKNQPKEQNVIRAFQSYQRIEMNHRHRMLHQFEKEIHRLEISSEKDVDRLWLSVNQQFYGDRVILESDFETAWQDVHHWFTSPFYLSVYGVAKEKADNTTVSDLIIEQYIAHARL